MISLRKLLPLMALTLCLGVLYLPGCDTLVTEVNEFTIAGHPTAEFAIDSNSVDSGCTPLTVGFIDKSTGPHDTWIWNYGDNTADTFSTRSDITDSGGLAPTHVYESAGTYSVSLTIIDSSIVDEPGADQEVKGRFIIVGSTIDSFSVDSAAGCPGVAVTFTPLDFGGITNYHWDFGDGSSPVGDSSPTHTYDSIGVFSCTLTIDAACGSDFKIGYDSLITINPCPIARIGADVLYGCQPLPVTFEDTTDYRGEGRDSLFWWMSRNDTLIDSARTDSTWDHEFTTPGKYVVWADVYSEDLTATDTLDDTIVVWGPAFATIIADGVLAQVEGCIDSFWLFYVDFEAVLPDTVLIESFDSIVWEFGDGTRSNPNDPMPLQVSHPYDSADQFTVRLLSYGGCNADTAIDHSVMNMVCVSWPFDTLLAGFTVTPDADSVAEGIQGDTTVTFTFTDTTVGGMLGRNWEFGDASGLSDTGMVVTYQFEDIGTYTVTLTVGNCCASVQATQTIVVDTLGAFSSFRRYRDPSDKR